MSHTDRGICIRNHVMGVLVTYAAKGLNYSNLGELAGAITEEVIEADKRWFESGNVVVSPMLDKEGPNVN